jgi:periplasmic protein TonB
VRARSGTRARTFGLLAMSTAAHLIVFTMLGLVPPPSEVLAMEDIEIEVMEPEPEVEPPPPPPPPEPEPEPKEPVQRAEPKAAPPPPEPEAAPPPEEVADFTGVTLTGGDGSWSTAVGSGAPLTGPVGKINRGPSQPQQAAKAMPVGPRFVPAGSLARKPQQPAGLSELLEQNYPRRARMQGIGGKARVLLRILPNGRAVDIKVADESPEAYGFAAACIKTIKESPPFTPGLDRGGTAVATEVPFNCDFVVDD